MENGNQKSPDGRIDDRCTELKALGAHWNRKRKAWWITSADLAQVEQIINKPGADIFSPLAVSEGLEHDRNNILGTANYAGRS